MKKSISIVLLALFAVATTGVPLSTHYCGGQLVGSQLALPVDTDPCHCPGEMPMEGCCQDDLSYEKVDSDFLQSITPVLTAKQLVDIPFVIIKTIFQTNISTQPIIFTLFRDKAPPLHIGGRSVSILYQSFLL